MQNSTIIFFNKINVTLHQMDTILIYLNPLNPEDASKHHFESLKNVLKPRGFTRKIVMELFNNNNTFFSFVQQLKSFLSTTIRELR